MKTKDKHRYTIKIIGMGRFGTLLSNIISANFAGLKLIDDVAEADVVFPSVPISAFEEVIKSIAPKLKRGAIVIDVCSVKVYPVKIMKKHLKADTQIIATHPLFGPDSAKNGLSGLPLVVWPVRISDKKFNIFIKMAENIGLSVHKMSPEEHDKITAYTQVYTHLIGRVGQELNIKRTSIDTLGFQRLYSVQEQVVHDTDELFFDMNKFNPYAAQMRKKVLNALWEVEKRLASDYNGRRRNGKHR